MEKSLVFNLDDFCESYMTKEKWDLLFEMEKVCPELKITMFTIPGLCSRRWLAYVKEKFPWIEMALHGAAHDENDVYYTSIDAQRSLGQYNPAYFCKGFKAPQWRLRKEAYDEIRKSGFWVAVNRSTAEFNEDGLTYRYDTGKEIRRDFLYDDGGFLRLHGHITTAPNGIGEVSGDFFNVLSNVKNCKFISELFPCS